MKFEGADSWNDDRFQVQDYTRDFPDNDSGLLLMYYWAVTEVRWQLLHAG